MAAVHINTRKKKEISPCVGIYTVSLLKTNNLRFANVEKNIFSIRRDVIYDWCVFNKENKGKGMSVKTETIYKPFYIIHHCNDYLKRLVLIR
jgi:hypothetical protein